MFARRAAHRRVAAPALATVLALTLAACTSGSPEPRPSASPSSSAASPTTGPVTLRLAVYGGPEKLAAYDELADAFTAKFPDVTVKVEKADDEVTSDARVDQELAKGTGPDVFVTSQDHLPQLIAEDRVQPVDELLEKRGILFGDRFQRLGLESMAADSALQCMPSEVSPYVVVYNKRLLQPSLLAEPGEDPPTPENGWTWDQFQQAARAMSKDGVKGAYFPPELSTLIPLVRSAGEDLMDDPRMPTTLTMADDGPRAALEEILTVARDPLITPTPRELQRQDPVTRFERGRLGMMIGTRDLVPRLRKTTDLSFDVYPLPRLGRTRTVADVAGYCIAAETEHTGPAADFVTFASQNEGAAIMARSGAVVPANLEVLNSDAFDDPTKFPRNADVFSNSIRRADAMPFSVAWPQVVEQTKPFVDRLFYAPLPDLDALLPKIDELSAALLVTPSESPSP